MCNTPKYKHQELAFLLNDESTNETLEDSAVGRLMDQLQHPVIKVTANLQDRLLRLLSHVIMTLPDDTAQRIGALSDRPHLQNQLNLVVKVR